MSHSVADPRRSRRRGPRCRTARVAAKGGSSGPESALRAAVGRVNGERMGRGRGERTGGRLAPLRIGSVPPQYSVSARLDGGTIDPRGVRGPGQSGDTAGGGRCSGGAGERFLHGTLGPVAGPGRLRAGRAVGSVGGLVSQRRAFCSSVSPPRPGRPRAPAPGPGVPESRVSRGPGVPGSNGRRPWAAIARG